MTFLEEVALRDPDKWLILTHPCCDFDAITGITLLDMYGEGRWPGIKEAEVAFLGNGGSSVFGLTEAELIAQKILCVDMGGGMYDHHSHGQEEKSGECATSLVVKDLNIEQEPHVWNLMDYCLRVDAKGCSEDEIPYFIDRLFRQAGQEKPAIEEAFRISQSLIFSYLTVGLPDFDWQFALKMFKEQAIDDDERNYIFLKIITPAEPSQFSLLYCLARIGLTAEMFPEVHPLSGFVVPTVTNILRESYDMEQKELTEVAEEELRLAVKKQIKAGSNMLTIAFANSDCRTLGKLAKSQSHEVAVLVQEFSTKHKLVFINRRLAYKFVDVKVSDLVKAIRWHEMGSEDYVPAKVLGAPGRMEHDAHWWFDQHTLTIINGGSKHPDVPPSKLSGEELFQIIENTLNGSYFPPNFASNCQAGRCTHHDPERVCPMFGCQLHRCIQIRASDPSWQQSLQPVTFAPRTKPLR